VLTRPGILSRCAGLLAGWVPDDTDRLAARGDTAVALAAAISLRTGAPLLFASEAPPDEPIKFGGDLFPAARVVLVEDVILTGTHARESARALMAQDLRVTTVVALLDRGQDGRFRLEADEGLTCSIGFREEDLLP
jgi:orotate phosphoribosyltransferase